MAGNDARKQLLTLIHDFASEKSHGERRVVGLKNRIEELRSELEVANANLEGTKRNKEAAEQELKGFEVELSMNETTIQTLESRISLTQDEISAVGSDLEALKNKEATSRDQFISEMFEINTKIRKFQESIAGNVHDDEYIGSAEEEDPKLVKEKEEVTEGALRTLEDMLAGVISQTTEVEEEYKSEQNIQKQVQQALIDCERKMLLMEEMLKATKALQDLTRQTAELEQICATLGEKLQRRCICPSCHLDNVEVLGGLIQSSEAN